MSDKEKEKPDFRKVADRNYDYYGSEMQSFIEGCEHVWKTEVVKRDEEIRQLIIEIADYDKAIDDNSNLKAMQFCKLEEEIQNLNEEIKQLKERIKQLEP